MTLIISRLIRQQLWRLLHKTNIKIVLECEIGADIAAFLPKGCTLKAVAVRFSNKMCSTSNSMSSRTLLSDHVCTSGYKIWAGNEMGEATSDLTQVPLQLRSSPKYEPSTFTMQGKRRLPTISRCFIRTQIQCAGGFGTSDDANQLLRSIFSVSSLNFVCISDFEQVTCNARLHLLNYFNNPNLLCYRLRDIYVSFWVPASVVTCLEDSYCLVYKPVEPV
jgi:hypothetical protein